MSLPVFASGDLNSLRRDLYGRDCEIAFYKITPSAGETEIARFSTDWHLWRLPRATGEAATGAIKIMLTTSAAVAVEHLRLGCVVDVVLGANTKRYKVVELTETQQLGGGWVLVCDPIGATV